MTDSKKPHGKHLKKEASLKVAELLTAALGDLKENLGEKKFFRNIKKASKAMIAGLSDKETKPTTNGKKAAAGAKGHTTVATAKADKVHAAANGADQHHVQKAATDKSPVKRGTHKKDEAHKNGLNATRPSKTASSKTATTKSSPAKAPAKAHSRKKVAAKKAIATKA
ncbi:hypothetical protein ACDQ55_20515 [Chitinophaga sp. 30R24]|uniref:hypothetical protein n=1 Tax=Chitinophaga sp. 30R24 TaxID=3248838 RepID=UPI003B913B53